MEQFINDSDALIYPGAPYIVFKPRDGRDETLYVSWHQIAYIQGDAGEVFLVGGDRAQPGVVN
jgi:hypothetical protein